MRSELQEVGRGGLTSATRWAGDAPAAISPSAVDAALEDESTPIVSPQDSRRDITAAASGDTTRFAIDGAHAAAAGSSIDSAEGSLLRRLSRQLNLLEIQQQQIRRLIEQAERRATSAP
jgi:hypothetical protein